MSSDRIHCLIARLRRISAINLVIKAHPGYHPDMNPLPRHLLLLIVVGVLAAGSVYAKQPQPRQAAVGDARNGDDTRDGDDNRRKGQSNLPESVRRVERQTGGEVLRAEPMQRDGREVYRVKVLTSDGRVRVIQDDPQRNDQSDREQRSDEPSRARQRANDASGNDGASG